MKKNNCCKICGRLDYDDNGGNYLVCRICGERRKKYPLPIKETALFVLMVALAIFFIVCGITTGAYIPKNGNLHYGDTDDNIMTGRNDFDDFMNSIRYALVWICPLCWSLAIIATVLAVKLFSKIKVIPMYKL